MPREGVYFCDFAGLILFKLAHAGAQDPGADKSGDAAHHMNGAGTGKIVEAHLREPAAAPDPVRFDGIDQCGDDSGVDTVGQKFCPFCHGAGYDGCGGGTEDQVKDEIGPVKICITGKDIKSRLSDQAHKVFTQQKAEANQDKDDGADTEIHEVFHQDIAGVFGAGKACFYHGESRLHPEYQGGADQEPDGEKLAVQGVHHFFSHHKSSSFSDRVESLPGSGTRR